MVAQSEAVVKAREFRSLPVVKNQTELSAALQELSKDYNVLVPQQMNFASSTHRVALEAVYIDPRVDEKKNGVDIYSYNGTDYTFHTHAANRIAAAANLKWTKEDVATRELGDDKRVVHVEFRVGWSVKRPNGAERSGMATGTYDYEEDRKSGMTPKQVEGRRKKATQLAESNAKLRAIFDALEMLPRSMKLEDFKKPFLVPCVIEDLMDMIREDPAMKAMFIAAKTGIADQVYGPGSVRQSAPIVAHEDINENQNPAGGGAEVSEAVVVKTKREKWAGMDVNQQDEEMKRLLKAKGKTWTWKQLFGEMADAKRLDALEYFDAMEDVKAEEKAPWEKGEGK